MLHTPVIPVLLRREWSRGRMLHPLLQLLTPLIFLDTDMRRPPLTSISMLWWSSLLPWVSLAVWRVLLLRWWWVMVFIWRRVLVLWGRGSHSRCGGRALVMVMMLLLYV